MSDSYYFSGYRLKQAQHLAEVRRLEKIQPRFTVTHWQWIETLLREDWSPEQINLWLAKEGYLFISHKWNYQYILQYKQQGGDLYRHLGCQKQ